MSLNNSETLSGTLKLSPDSQAIIAGGLSSLAYLYIALNSQGYGDFNLTQLLATSLFCASLSFWIWFVHTRQNQEIQLSTLLGFALLFRLIGGFSFPILEDDFYRYLWDARMTIEAGSPYGIPPSNFFAADHLSEPFESILDGINYPYIETIYGPTSQWLFALAYLISPGEVWPLQLLMGLIDLSLILMLLKLAKPTSVLLYAWSPLVIKEFVITAHPDVLGVMFIVLAMLLLNKRRLLGVGICMALACGVKIFAVILLPFLLRFEWKSWLVFFATAIAIAMPFGLQQAWLPGGLSAMGSSWLFNAPLYFLADTLMASWISLNSIKLVLIGSLALGCASYLVHYLLKGADVIAHQELRGDLLYASLFLCAPVFNAWYLVWLLPFAVFRPSIWAWLLSVTILLSYASGINLNNTELEPYEHWGWIIALQFIPPLLAAGRMIFRSLK